MEATSSPRFVAVMGSTWAGVLVGACTASWMLERQWSSDGPGPSITTILTLYVLDAAVIVMCALLALYLPYRALPDIASGILWVGLGLVAGGLLSLAPAIALASTTGYSNERSVVGAEVGIVVVCCLVGTAAGALAWLRTRRISA
jgi:hypothetical protein